MRQYQYSDPRSGTVHKFDHKLGVLNKGSLENQLQNCCAMNSDESNETSDRMIRK